jgi:hypothetical protein
MDGRPSLDYRQASDALALEALVATADDDDNRGERSDGRGRDGRRTSRRPRTSVDEEEAYELEDAGLLNGDGRSSESSSDDEHEATDGKPVSRRRRRRAKADEDEEDEGSFAAIIRRVRPASIDQAARREQLTGLVPCSAQRRRSRRPTTRPCRR